MPQPEQNLPPAALVPQLEQKLPPGALLTGAAAGTVEPVSLAALTTGRLAFDEVLERTKNKYLKKKFVFKTKLTQCSLNLQHHWRNQIL